MYSPICCGMCPTGVRIPGGPIIRGPLGPGPPNGPRGPIIRGPRGPPPIIGIPLGLMPGLEGGPLGPSIPGGRGPCILPIPGILPGLGCNPGPICPTGGAIPSCIPCGLFVMGPGRCPKGAGPPIRGPGGLGPPIPWPPCCISPSFPTRAFSILLAKPNILWSMRRTQVHRGVTQVHRSLTHSLSYHNWNELHEKRRQGVTAKRHQFSN